MSRHTDITHEGVNYSARLAKITSVFLGFEDHGIFTASLVCEGHGWGITVGNRALGNSREMSPYLGQHLAAIMDTVGVRNWSDLTGREILVLFDAPTHASSLGSTAAGIAHLMDEDKTLIFEDHANAFFENSGG